MFLANIRSAQAIGVVMLAVGISLSPAWGATFVVDSNSDLANANQQPGRCGNINPITDEPMAGTCTLRSALDAANSLADSDIIEFGIADDTISINSELLISSSVTIDNSAADIVVDAQGTSRVMTVNAPASTTINVTIIGLTLSNGGGDDFGGALRLNASTAGRTANLTLDNVTVTASEATDSGGGLWLGAGNTVLIDGGSIDGNTAANNGGGLLSFSNLTLTGGLSVTGNTAVAGGGLYLISTDSESVLVDGISVSSNASTTGDGAGILIENRSDSLSRARMLNAHVEGNTTAAGAGGGLAVARGRLSVDQSTIAGNEAVNGGGIYLRVDAGGRHGGVVLSNCTISGNSASNNGGGIAAQAGNSTISQMFHCSLARNTAGTGTGGGFALVTPPTTNFSGAINQRFAANLIAENDPQNCDQAFDFVAANAGALNNLSDDNSCGTLGDGSIVGENPRIRDLADYGGSAPTHAIRAGSPAIDAGTTPFLSNSDQRGAPRADGLNDGSVVNDIGAYEFGGFSVLDFDALTYEVREDVATDSEDPDAAQIGLVRYGNLDSAASVVANAPDQGAEPTTPEELASNADYTPGSATINFAAGATTSSDLPFEIAITDDSEVEPDEYLDLTLSNALANGGSGPDIGPNADVFDAMDAPTRLTIEDVEEGLLRFEVTSPAPVTEPADGQPPVLVTLTVTRGAGRTNGEVSVGYRTVAGVTDAPNNLYGATASGSAPGDVDFTAISDGRVTIADGEVSASVQIEVLADGEDEFNDNGTVESEQEFFTVELFDAQGGAEIDSANDVATIRIDDVDDPVPGELFIAAATADSTTEGNNLVVTVTRSGGDDRAARVRVFPDFDGQSAEGLDFGNPGGGFISWADDEAGDKTFTIQVPNDSTIESNERFLASLADVEGAALSVTETIAKEVLIISVDQPVFQFTAASQSVAEGNTTIQVRISRGQFPDGEDITLTVTTADGTAVAGDDYTAIPLAEQTVTFSAGGATSVDVDIDILADAVSEADESFTANLSNPVNGAEIGTQDSTEITILGDATVRFFAARQETGGEGTAFILEASRDKTVGPSTIAFEIFTRAEGNPASDGSGGDTPDYAAILGANGQVFEFADGQSVTSVDFNIFDDSLVEGDESFFVRLLSQGENAATSGALPGDPAETEIVITDDDFSFEIAPATQDAISEGGTAMLMINRVGTGEGAATVNYQIGNAGDSATADEDYTPSGAQSVDFAASETSKMLPISIEDDNTDEGSESFSITLTNLASFDDPDEGSAGFNDTAVVEIADNDVAGVTVTPVSIAVTEGGATADYSLVLNTQPTDDVVITIGTDAQLSAPASVTFTSMNWDTAQPVTVTAVDDAVVEGDHSGAITHSVASNDGNYNGVAADGVSADITDNDATVRFTAATTTVNEDDGAGGAQTVTLTVERIGATNQEATVDFASADGTATDGDDYTGNSDTITFGVGVSSQEITFDTVADLIEEGNEAFTVSLSNLSANLVAADPQSSTVTITDNDTAGVTIDVGDGITVTEGAATDTYTIVLNTEPTADVTVTISPSSDPSTELATDVASVTFTPTGGANPWNVAQTVTVNAVDDNVVEGDHGSAITHSVDSADPNYADGSDADTNLSAGSVDAAITDNDATVSFVSATAMVAEDGSSVNLTVTRSGATIQAASFSYTVTGGNAQDGTDYSLSPASPIEFAVGETEQSITVTSELDDLAEGDETLEISIAVAAGSESRLQEGAILVNTTTITDDDVAGVTVTPVDTTMTEGDAAETASYTVVLNTQPTDDVVITLSGGSTTSVDGQLTTDVSSLTFTGGNWDTAQTVTVTAVDDSGVEADPHDGVVTMTAASAGDASYDGIAVADFSASITDNDATVSFASATATVAEDGSSVNLTVTRSGATIQAASFSYTVTGGNAQDGTDYSLSPASPIEFAVGETEQSITVTSELDDLAEGDETLEISIAVAAGSESRLQEGAILVNTTTITDDDVAGVIVDTGDGLTVAEGDAGSNDSLSVVLSSQPQADVVIDLSSSPLQLAANPASLTFTSANWNVAQPVIVAAVDDTAVEANPHDGSLSFDISAGDADYLALSIADVTASISDNDSSLQFALASSSASEAAGSVTINVTRVGVVADPVTVMVASADDTASAGSDYQAVSQTLSWGAGDGTDQSFTVTINQDNIAEADERLNLVLGATTGPAVVGTPGTLVLTITDDDTPGIVVSESDGATTVSERPQPTQANGGVDSYTLALQSEPSADVSISLASLNTAQMTVSPASLNFTPQNFATPQTITLTAVNDRVVDAQAVAPVGVRQTVSSSDPAYDGFDLAPLFVQVRDNDSAIRFAVDTITINEVATVATVSVTRTGVNEGLQEVGYRTVGGTATEGEDYQPVDGRLSWANGQGGARNFSITIIDDDLDEGTTPEQVILQLFDPDNDGGLGEASLVEPSEALLLIIDDEAGGDSQGRTGGLGWFTIGGLFAAVLWRRRRRANAATH